MNLLFLDIERHLIMRGGSVSLVPEHEVKNSHLIDFEIPADTAELLAWYVRGTGLIYSKALGLHCFPASMVGRSPWSFGAADSKAVFQYTGLE